MNLSIAGNYSTLYLHSSNNNYKKNNLKTLGFSGQELLTAEVKGKLIAIDNEIKQANKIVILTHEGSDGDAAGSSAALKNSIAAKYPDKKIDVFIINNLPKASKSLKDTESFEFINQNSDIESIKARDYDLAISVDFSTKKRMGKGSEIFDSAKRKIKIDHHLNGTDFADVNLVCSNASAASQIVFLLANQMEVNLNTNLAADILLGIFTDTGNLQYNIIKPSDVYQDCSILTKKVDPRTMQIKTTSYMPQNALPYYSDAIKDIRFNGGIVYFVSDAEKNKEKADKYNLSLGDVKKTQDRIFELMKKLKGVQIAVKFTNKNDDTLVQLCGKGINVNEIAEKYGAGGGCHEDIASFIISKKPEEFIQEIAKTIEDQKK